MSERAVRGADVTATEVQDETVAGLDGLVAVQLPPFEPAGEHAELGRVQVGEFWKRHHVVDGFDAPPALSVSASCWRDAIRTSVGAVRSA